jgi:hypothetical protein
MCYRCWGWFNQNSGNPVYMAPLLACTSLEDFLAIREETAQPTWKTDAEKQAEVSTDECPVCQVLLEHRPTGVRMPEYRKKLNAARMLSETLESNPTLQDFDCICTGCFTRLSKIGNKTNTSLAVKRQCNEAKTTTSLDRLIEIMEERECKYIRAGQGDRSARTQGR